MDFLTFEVVEGKRKGSQLIWINEEKFLHFKKDERAGRKVYQCYQNKIDKNSPCSARRLIDSKGIVTTNAIPHSSHLSHGSIYSDMKTRSGIIDSCIQAATALEGLHVTVPTQQIFTRELAK